MTGDSRCRPPHFAGLDSLRGIAAFSVLIFHLPNVGPLHRLGYVANSYLMVDVFFVLSGFVIAYAYGSRLTNPKQFGPFLWLRFWRLYPVHLVTLLLAALLIIIERYAGSQGFWVDGWAIKVNDLPAFAANLLLVHSLHVMRHPAFNVASWSISVEFYTYIAFAAIVMALRRPAAIFTAAGIFSALGMIGLLFVVPGVLTYTIWFGILRCFAGFFLGTLVFALYARLSVSAAASNRLGWATIAAMAFFVLYLWVKPPLRFDVFVYPLAGLMVLAVAMAGNSPVLAFLFSRPLVWLGAVSYSLYMVHGLLIQVQGFVLPNLAPQLVGPPRGLSDVLCRLGIMATTIGLSLVLAHLSYVYIERPWRDWSRRRVSAGSP